MHSFLINKGIDISSICLLQVYDFSKEDAQKAIKMKLKLKNKGKEIYSSGLQVSTIVINKGRVLCTMDTHLKILEEFDLKLFLV